MPKKPRANMGGGGNKRKSPNSANPQPKGGPRSKTKASLPTQPGKKRGGY